MKFKKDNRDEIIKICDDLENEKKHTFYNFNPIESTKDTLKRHINDDKNNFIKLKAQLEMHSYDENTTSTMIAYITSIISLIITCIINIINLESNYLDKLKFMYVCQNGIIIIAVFMLLLSVIHIIPRLFNKLTFRRKKWLTYIKYALEDIEKDFEHK
jgi:hypothetical protein